MAVQKIKLNKSSSQDKTKKHSLEFRKKHIQNAKVLEKQKRDNVIYRRIKSWLKEDEVILPETIRQYFSCIKQLVKLMNYEYKKNIILATVIYANKYIQNVGMISVNHLFRLLLTSTIVTIKFWEDGGVDLELCSYVFGITKKEINDMERHFLVKIGYELFLKNEDIENFEHESLGIRVSRTDSNSSSNSNSNSISTSVGNGEDPDLDSDLMELSVNVNTIQILVPSVC